MEAILNSNILLAISLVIFIIYGILKTQRPPRYVTYVETFDIDLAWSEFHKRVKINPTIHGIEIIFIDGKYIVRKEI